ILNSLFSFHNQTGWRRGLRFFLDSGSLPTGGRGPPLETTTNMSLIFAAIDVEAWFSRSGQLIAGLVVFAFCAAAVKWLLGIRYLPHAKVGIVEKLWSPKGSLTEGRIVALNGEAGFQTTLLRGGLHPWYFPWQYRIHKEPLVTVSEGRIGYVYARDGAPLPPTQTLGRIVESNHFQDAVVFLQNGGQRGRQRAILREGVFAINQALFVVITEDGVYSGPIKDKAASQYLEWQKQLSAVSGFNPVVIGGGGEADLLSYAGGGFREEQTERLQARGETMQKPQVAD